MVCRVTIGWIQIPVVKICLGADRFCQSSGMVQIMELNDPDIRAALLLRLANQPVRPRAVIEELRVHNGNAIADVVALYSEAHCFEIKGCTDKITRITKQGAFYNTAFRKITLVVTDRNLRRARRLSPRYWGIMVARYVGGNVRLSYVRPAKVNPRFDKALAIQTLWKSEMLSMVAEKAYVRKSRDFLATLICATRRKAELSTRICELLVARQQTIRSWRLAPYTKYARQQTA